jgi:hypothetical protein
MLTRLKHLSKNSTVKQLSTGIHKPSDGADDDLQDSEDDDSQANEDDALQDGGDDPSQSGDSHDGEHEASFALRRVSAKPQTQPDSWVESSSLEPVDTPTTSVSETGTLSAPPSSFCMEH